MNETRFRFFGFLVFLGLFACAWSPAGADDAIKGAVERLKADIAYLASDELKGRDVGSEGIATAGEFIVKRFDELGVKTDSFDGSAYQEFTLPGPAEMGAPEQNFLTVTGPDYSQNFVLGETVNPLSLGSSGKFEGEVVFAGYGISAPDLGYDDYKDVDVEGKVVIVIRKEPQQQDNDSIFEGRRSSQYAYFSTKEIAAALKKAAALIIVNDGLTVESGGDGLIPVVGAGKAMTEQQVPTVNCSRASIDEVLSKACGKTLADFEASIDKDLNPVSQVLEGFSARGETLVEQTKIPVRNVVGLLPGTGTLAEEYVVVGAHYDHVGMGGQGSLAPGTIEIHNGADDNASGTTTMMEVARRMAADKSENRRSIVFMAFTGEERGLLGSKHYCRFPRWPLEDTVAMVNMDMVGRLTDNRLTVYGLGTAEGFKPMINRLNEQGQFSLDGRDAGFGPSDHASFYQMDIPVFHFFTGLHNDYHRPSDDVEKVNYEGMARIATMVTAAVKEIAVSPDRPKYVKVTGFADVGRGRGRPQRNRARAVIGVELDLDFAGTGAAIAKVPESGPASEAGMKDGDIVIEIGGETIFNVRDLRRSMAGKQPGETVQVKVKRGEEELEFALKLGKG